MRSTSDAFRAVLRSLRFDRDCGQELRAIPPALWPQLLQVTDEARLTLPLGIRCRSALPQSVLSRIQRNLADNAERHACAVRSYQEIAAALGRRGIDFLFLKGLSHFPFFCDDPRHRQQYDIDLYSAPEDVRGVREAMTALGYETLERGGRARTDHLPVMIRKNRWRWRGDYYDPEMPLNVEAHFRLWDSATEMFAVHGAEEFWSRRMNRDAGGILIPTLALKDTVRYAAWHLIRHLLRGDLRAGHVYEFAHFLDRTAGDDSFWADWRGRYARDFLAEAMVARLACDAFGCRLNGSVRDLIVSLPRPVRNWFDLFALSPLLSACHPNKDELILHLSIARGARNKIRIAVRRLAPSLPSRFERDPHVVTPQRRALSLRNVLDQLSFVAHRAARHIRAVGLLTHSGTRWISRTLSARFPASR